MRLRDSVLSYLRRTATRHDEHDDAALLGRFAAGRDESAYSAIVNRHGAMVLGLCRRLLRHEQDAEDAFQATFLILARKAGTQQWRNSVAGWLHTVARRVCRRALAVHRRQAMGERVAAKEHRPAVICEQDREQLQASLDEEIERLPQRYRLPLLLCCLAGLKTTEAAQRLKCSEGAVRGRLFRARKMLRHRLVRRGIALSAASLAAALPEGSAPAVAGESLSAETVRAAMSLAAGSHAAGRTASVVLARGVLRAMFFDKVRLLAALLLSVSLLGGGAVWAMHRLAGRGMPRDERASQSTSQPSNSSASDSSNSDSKDWKFPDVAEDDPVFLAGMGLVLAVDADKRRLLMRMQKSTLDAPFEIDAKARMAFGPPQAGRSSFAQDIDMSGLRKGMVLGDIERSENGRSFTSFTCSWPTLDGKVQSVDVKKGTLTIDNAAMTKSLDAGTFDGQKTFALAKQGTVAVDGPNLKPFQLALEDIPVGREVFLELEKDRTVRLVTVDADGDVRAVLRSVDADKRTIRVALKSDGNTPELAFEVQKSGTVRLAGKSVDLGELKIKMPVLLRMADDRRTVIGVWAAEE